MKTQTEQNETFLVFGMIRIVDEFGVFIVKNGLRFFEAHAMLFKIQHRLAPIPLESQFAHGVNVVTM